jgi:hypothetical protein
METSPNVKDEPRPLGRACGIGFNRCFISKEIARGVTAGHWLWRLLALSWRATERFWDAPRRNADRSAPTLSVLCAHLAISALW